MTKAYKLKATTPIETRFWNKVSKGESCWIWTGAKDSRGYGSLTVGRRNEPSNTIMPHRFSYTIHHGPIPQGMVIMHSCDNPACVNPDHLSAGTQKENLEDAVQKGRLVRGNFRRRTAPAVKIG